MTKKPDIDNAVVHIAKAAGIARSWSGGNHQVGAFATSILKELEKALAVLIEDYPKSGPANEREEVTGLSTNGQNKNVDGGCGYVGG